MMNIKRTAEDAAAGEDPDELYLAENVFWVPKEARWSHLQANAKLIDGRDRGGESRACGKRCPCVLSVQFRRSVGAFTRARSGEC